MVDSLGRALRPAMWLLLIAFVLRIEPLLGLATGMAMWAVAGWVVPARSAARVSARRHHPSRAFFGEEVEITFEVTNASSLPVPWMSVVDPIPFDLGATSTRWVTRLAGRETRSMRRVVEARRRGYHVLGPGVVSTGDTFGLRRAEGRPVPSSGLLVYPRIVPLDRSQFDALAPLPLSRSALPLHEDPSRLIGVRGYRPGDPLRRMHWPATAAVGSLQVKQFEFAVLRQVVVAADLSSTAHPHPGRRRSVELAVTTAASLLHHLVVIAGQEAGLRLLAADAPTGRIAWIDRTPRGDQAHLMEMLEALARAKLVRDLDGSRLVASQGLAPGTALVLVAGRLSHPVALGLLELRTGGVRPAVVLTTPLEEDEWAGRLQGRGVPVRSAVSLAEVGEL